MLLLATGPIRLNVEVPPGMKDQTTLLYMDEGFGRGYDLDIETNAELKTYKKGDVDLIVRTYASAAPLSPLLVVDRATLAELAVLSTDARHGGVLGRTFTDESKRGNEASERATAGTRRVERFRETIQSLGVHRDLLCVAMACPSPETLRGDVHNLSGIRSRSARARFGEVSSLITRHRC